MTPLADDLGAMDVEKRTITADDWPLLRDVSLRALADSPDVFRRKFAETEALPDDFWRQRAERSAQILVVLEDGPRSLDGWCLHSAERRRRLRLGHVDGA